MFIKVTSEVLHLIVNVKSASAQANRKQCLLSLSLSLSLSQRGTAARRCGGAVVPIQFNSILQQVLISATKQRQGCFNFN